MAYRLVAALLVLTTPCIPQSREERVRAFAAARLRVWQDRLSLGNWKISTDLMHASALRPRTVGQLEVDYPKRMATIRILDPSDYRGPDSSALELTESVVVHELVHLSLTPILKDWRGEESVDREEERAVQKITRALLQSQVGN